MTKCAETTILIIEDDNDISSSLVRHLNTAQFKTAVCDSAENAYIWLKENSADLILLDIMLPGENGLEFCRKIRSSQSPPIIMVTALDDPIDNVVGLEIGADDYVSKPFDLNVLMARIRAVLRRSTLTEDISSKTAAEPVIRFSGFTFYPFKRYLIDFSGIRKPLTGAETDLLLVFCQHFQKVLSREDLMEWTRGNEEWASTRSIDLLISRLRKKLLVPDKNEEFIRTLRNNGYMFIPEVWRG